jgi:hypothetical protein
MVQNKLELADWKLIRIAGCYMYLSNFRNFKYWDEGINSEVVMSVQCPACGKDKVEQIRNAERTVGLAGVSQV